MSSKPIVGVTGPDRGGFTAWIMTALALRRCGARPVRITPRSGVDESLLDALVIGGGTDVDPLQYGEQPEDPVGESDGGRNTVLDWTIGLLLTVVRALFARHSRPAYDLQRDQLETRLIRHALYYDLPILGICRGAQLMNVVLGGSLHQQIGHFYTEDTYNVRSILPSKSVTVATETHLHRILGKDNCRVNALHDQSVDRLGDQLRVAAVESSGVVQAIEHTRHSCFIGVQWHPEYIPQSRTQQHLFAALALRARE